MGALKRGGSKIELVPLGIFDANLDSLAYLFYHQKYILSQNGAGTASSAHIGRR